jgi:AcrR family transcriptional regulator
MPKLAKQRADQNRCQIEKAAFSLFTRQGFHGTNIRDIAELAQVSTGAIYTYFPTKDALYVSVVESYQKSVVYSYQKRIRSWLAREFENSQEPFSRHNLEGLAREIRSFVYDHADYWKLMYIDVVEFKNQHFAHSFHNVPEQFNWTLDAQLRKVASNPAWRGIDPGFVLATIYMQILTYFLVERLFGGEQHLGVPEDTAIRRMIDMALNGIWRMDIAGSPRAGNQARRKRSKNKLGKPGKTVAKAVAGKSGPH